MLEKALNHIFLSNKFISFNFLFVVFGNDFKWMFFDADYFTSDFNIISIFHSISLNRVDHLK